MQNRQNKGDSASSQLEVGGFMNGLRPLAMSNLLSNLLQKSSEHPQRVQDQWVWMPCKDM
jgi:hypothetical protein